MTIKKGISLRDDLYDFAEDKASKLFSDNFSGYIAYLISKEMNTKEAAEGQQDQE